MLETGNQAPPFLLRAVDGSTVSLHEILHGGPAVIAFFKVSCPVCQLAFPFLAKIAARGKAQFLGVSQDDEAATKRFLASCGVNFTTLLDERGEGYPVSNSFAIRHVPAIFVVERDGRISRAWSGFSKKDLEQVGERFEAAPFGPEDRVPMYKPG